MFLLLDSNQIGYLPDALTKEIPNFGLSKFFLAYFLIETGPWSECHRQTPMTETPMTETPMTETPMTETPMNEMPLPVFGV